MQASLTNGAGAPAATPASRPSLLPARILVVEDDRDLRRLNTEVLTRAGYLVDGAEDGDAGWTALETDSYDLLITDNNMPKLTGLDLLKKLRSARIVLPVIMATGTLPAHEFAQSPWLIPDATLIKPYTVPELLAAVQAVLSSKEGDPVTRPVALQTNGSHPSLANGSESGFKLSVLDWEEVDQTVAHEGKPPS